MLTDASLQSLRASFRGRLIEPTDPGYLEACTIHNGMIHKRPRLIAQCADVADVIATVNIARETDSLVSIRCGGHNAGGLGLCDDGIVIDLTSIRYARVDPLERTVVVGGGTPLGEVDHVTHAFGLAAPFGIISTTGVGGLTLGGGVGHLTRRCGLSIDNLLAVDMVLADGSFVQASADHNPDLFWAVRGGGGNFGVVTAFTFQLHPIETVVGGPILWELSDAKKILRWYREFILQAPDELNGFFAFLTVPPAAPFPEHLHLKKLCGIVWNYSGPAENADAIFAPIRAIAKPALDFVGPLPYTALQGMFDALVPAGLQYYWRADFFTDISDDAIDEHLRYAAELPSMLSTMHLYPVNGAAGRVENDATAWSYRNANFAGVVLGVETDPANNEKMIEWTRNYWNALHPYSAGGAYVNFMMEEGEDRVKATYGANYARLAQIKRRYDPNNLFRVNQNIKPAAAPQTVLTREVA